MRLRRIALPSGPPLDPVRSGVQAGAASIARDERAVRATSSTILGMVLFVASEAMFFAAFFGAYFTVYTAHTVWPPANLATPGLVLPTIATAVLLASLPVLQYCLRAAARRRDNAVRLALALTLAAGVVFLVLTVAGYANVPFGIKDGVFPSMFYLITVVGAAHVVGGVILALIVLQQVGSGQVALTAYEPLRAFAIYWNFVALLATAIYLVFYLLLSS